VEKTNILKSLSTGSFIANFSLLHPISNLNKLSIDVFEASSNGVLNRFTDLFLDESSSEWFESLVQEIVVGLWYRLVSKKVS
jgi:hypothetical protein